MSLPFGVPRLRGPDRLKAELRTTRSLCGQTDAILSFWQREEKRRALARSLKTTWHWRYW